MLPLSVCQLQDTWESAFCLLCQSLHEVTVEQLRRHSQKNRPELESLLPSLPGSCSSLEAWWESLTFLQRSLSMGPLTARLLQSFALSEIKGRARKMDQRVHLLLHDHEVHLKPNAVEGLKPA